MRIAMLTTPKGGAYTHSITLGDALAKAGHQVRVFGANKPFLDIPYTKTAYDILGLFNAVVSRHELSKKIKLFQPDLLHMHAPSGNADLMVNNLAEELNIPIAFSYHIVPFVKRTLMDRIGHLYFRVIEKSMSNADVIICATEQVKRHILRSKCLSNKKVHLIPYGVDMRTFQPCASKQSGPALRILFVGRVNPEKGIGLLLRAVSRIHREYELTIVGSSIFINYYKLKYRNMPHVKWVNWVDTQQKLAALYSAADITVVPSLWEEAFGLVVVESMACVTPAMTFDYITVADIIDHGVDGFILSGQTSQNVTSFLEQINRNQLHQMGRLARVKVLQKFGVKQMLASTLQVYTSTYSEFHQVQNTFC